MDWGEKSKRSKDVQLPPLNPTDPAWGEINLFSRNNFKKFDVGEEFDVRSESLLVSCHLVPT
jgi:hypothetical protein